MTFPIPNDSGVLNFEPGKSYLVFVDTRAVDAQDLASITGEDGTDVTFVLINPGGNSPKDCILMLPSDVKQVWIERGVVDDETIARMKERGVTVTQISIPPGKSALEIAAAASVDVVEHMRERCARIAEDYAVTGGPAGAEIARLIRGVK